MTALRRTFLRDGFIVLRGFVPPPQIAVLRSALDTARERDPHDKNPLSLDGMRFASNLFYDNETIRDFVCSRPVVDLLCSLGGPDLWARWDQAVWKRGGAPAFPWHQDNGYTGLDVQHLQLWVAITEMTPQNGGLVLSPGGHRHPSPHRWVGNHVEIDPPERVVAVDAAPGDVVVFSSFLPHMTTPNTTGDARLAYVAEYLPLRHPDRSVRPPHLIAARGARPVGRFEDLSAAWDEVPARRPGGYSPNVIRTRSKRALSQRHDRSDHSR